MFKLSWLLLPDNAGCANTTTYENVNDTIQMTYICMQYIRILFSSLCVEHFKKFYLMFYIQINLDIIWPKIEVAPSLN